MRPETSATPVELASAAARSNILMFPVIAAVGWAATIAVARVLSFDDFALYAVALALKGTIQFLVDLGTGAASARLFAELQHMGARRQAWRLYSRLASGRAVAVVALVAAIAIAPGAFASVVGLRGDETYVLGFVAAIGAAEVAALLGYYVLSGTLQLGAANRVTLAQSVLQPMFVLVAATAGWGLVGILTALLAGSVVRAVGWNFAAIRALRSLRESDAELQELGRVYSRVAASAAVGKAASWAHTRQVASIVALSASPRDELATFALSYDFVHQAVQASSAPTSGIVLPSFSIAAREREMLQRRFEQAIRIISLMTFPAAAILVGVGGSLIPVAFGDGYDDALPYVLVIAPAVALELALLIPATGLMLTQAELLKPYLVIRLIELLLAVPYFVLAGVDLLLLTIFMMSVRVVSAAALHLAIYRRTTIHVDPAWLVRALAVAGFTALVGAASATVVPGADADVVAVPLISLATFAVLVRKTRILLPEDVALSSRVLPVAGRLMSILASPQPPRGA